jgi:hypothetical protein
LRRFNLTPSIVGRGDDHEATDFETVVTDMLAGEYKSPIGVLAFNAAEGWSRDVSADIACEPRRRRDLQLPDQLADFVDRHDTPDRSQPAFPLRLIPPIREEFPVGRCQRSLMFCSRTATGHCCIKTPADLESERLQSKLFDCARAQSFSSMWGTRQAVYHARRIRFQKLSGRHHCRLCAALLRSGRFRIQLVYEHHRRNLAGNVAGGFVVSASPTPTLKILSGPPLPAGGDGPLELRRVRQMGARATDLHRRAMTNWCDALRQTNPPGKSAKTCPVIFVSVLPKIT